MNDYSELRARCVNAISNTTRGRRSTFVIGVTPEEVLTLLDEGSRLRAVLSEHPCELFVAGCNLVHTDVDDGAPELPPLPMDERCLRCQMEAALNSSPEGSSRDALG